MSGAAAAAGPVGVFGGTFNPVHHGHLRTALELVEHLDLEHLRLLPCAAPPHRPAPVCGAGHRAAMVELGVAGEPRLRCDLRELERPGPSYTYDSLAGLREELGPDRPLVMVVGCDAVLGLTGWYRWRELPDLAHIVVVSRPGWELPGESGIGEWLAERRLDGPEALRDRPCGGVLIERLRPLDISSTEIRGMLARGLSPRYLLPEAVLKYIEHHGLYSEDPGER